MADNYSPSWQDQLGLLLMNLGGGVSAAGSANRPFWEGIAPGVQAYGNAAMQQRQSALQRQQQDEAMGLRRQTFDLQKATLQDKRDERARLGQAAASYRPPGMRVQPAGPTIGPGADYFTQVGGDESKGSYTIPNAKGSGAYGKYQFMPDTWADVATKNPQLGLPFNIRQSTPEQQESAMRALTAMNAKALQERGIQPAPDNLYLAHRFGTEGAAKIHGADPNAPIASLFPPIWSQQNPDMQGVTVAQFRQGVSGRYGGLPPVAQGGGTQAPALPDVPRPALPPADAQRIQHLVNTQQITAAQGDTQANQIIDSLWTHQREQAKAQYAQAGKDQWRTLEPKEIAMYPGLDPGKAYQRNQRGEIKPIGGSQVSIDMGGKAVNEILKSRGKQFETDIRPKAQDAVAEIDVIHQARQLLDAGIFSGMGTEAKVKAARVAALLGFDWGADQQANTAAFSATIAKRVATLIKNFGAGTGLSDADREYAQKMAGGEIQAGEQATRKILAIGERASRNLIKRYDADVSGLRKVEGFKDLPEEYWQLPEAPSYEEWSKANPPPPAPAVPPPPPGFTIVGPKGSAAPKIPPPPPGFRIMSP